MTTPIASRLEAELAQLCANDPNGPVTKVILALVSCADQMLTAREEGDVLEEENKARAAAA